jgi:signal transduction histidine kinase
LLFVPHAPQYGQLQVQNTGSGIPAGACARKFEPLCTTKPGGAELGLYIVQEIVQAHGGGQVTVEDVERQGTRLRSPYLGKQPCARLMIDDRCPFLRDLF